MIGLITQYGIMIFIGIGGGTVWLQNWKYGESLTLTVLSLHKFKGPCVRDCLKNFLNGNAVSVGKSHSSIIAITMYFNKQSSGWHKNNKSISKSQLYHPALISSCSSGRPGVVWKLMDISITTHSGFVVRPRRLSYVRAGCRYSNRHANTQSIFHRIAWWKVHTGRTNVWQ